MTRRPGSPRPVDDGFFPVAELPQPFGPAVPICWAAHTPDNRTISLQPGIRSAAINGKLTRLDQPPVLDGGRVLVPLRFVSEALGATVSWDAPRLTVAVSRNQALKFITSISAGRPSCGPVKPSRLPSMARRAPRVTGACSPAPPGCP